MLIFIMGILFELPLLIQLLSRIGLVSKKQLKVRGIGAFLQNVNITKMKILPYHSMARSKYAALGMTDTMPHVDSPTDDDLQKAVELLKSYGIPAISGRE